MSLGHRCLLLPPTATRAGFIALASAALAACAADPVRWDAAAERRLPAPPASATDAAEVAAESLAATGVVTALSSAPSAASVAPAVPVLPTAADPQACPASLRLATGRDGVVGAAWWSLRPDHSAALRASRSADRGRPWSAPIPVDTVDRSEAACDRPAPSIAIDSTNGYLHVAYSMEAPEGKGVFYAHQMDPRAGFERPQAVVYGDRPAATSVASSGDLVVVAYEDPNTGGRPFVSLALSHTAGHSFAERFAASERSSMSAERPVVALTRRRVALAWVERTAPRSIVGTDDPRSVTADRPSGVVVRVGDLRQ
ncbi:MAG TPA: hypothetical protein VGD56_09240 [Gemmatirosa sp.]